MSSWGHRIVATLKSMPFLRHSQPGLQFSQEVMRYLPGNIYWINRSGQLMGCNQNVLNSLQQHNHSTHIGKSYYDICTLNTEQHIEHDKWVMENDCATSFEEQQNGRTFITKKVPLHDSNNNVSGLLSTSIDITELKKSLQASCDANRQSEQLHQMKTDFIKNIRHDIKTPLSNLVGLAHIIKDLEKGTNKENLAADLAKAGNSVQKLFNMMFQCAALNDEFPINIEPICIKKIIDSVSNMLLGNATEKHICLIKDIKNTIPTCYSDSVRLRRIILNLLDNAIKATSFGKVMIRVETKEIAYNNLILTLTVTDTGIGVDAAEPVIAKKYIDDLGGQLVMLNEPNMGTEVICRIPVTLTESPLYTGGQYAI